MDGWLATLPHHALGDDGEPLYGPRLPAAGKRTLTQQLGARSTEYGADDGLGYLTRSIQMETAGRGAIADDPFAVHVAARAGVSGAGGTLPHLQAIQRSFGHHEVGGVRAHVGGEAAEASAAIGAHAYATGDDVAFAASPDLRQAAHEAAHVVQQRGDVRLDGGVGRAGDPYERHADAVAELVVRGESAEPLLDTMAHRGAAGGPAVQCDFSAEERAAARGAMVDDIAMEQIAHRIAYLDGHLPPPGPPAPSTPASTAAHAREGLRHADVDRLDSDALTALGFDVPGFQFFSGASGLQFWILPTRADSPRPGIIAFRGTEADGPADEAYEDLVEDATEAGVGMSQFSMNQGAIAGALHLLAARHPVVATGHSLGGALAQIATCFYPDLICSVVTFQAPGIPQSVLERLRNLPPDMRPDAHHHRVDGCLVDDAGEGFVGGLPDADGTRRDATLYGHSGITDGTFINPIHAHTSFPLLSGAPTSGPDDWRRAGAGAVDPALTTRASGSTDDASFGRELGGDGIAEWGRTHPALLAGGLGVVFGEGIGGLVGAAGGLALDEATAPRDLYARLWMTMVQHVEAVDGTFEHLKQHYIVAACTEAERTDFIRPMTSNFTGAYPEFMAAHQVALTEPDAMADEGRFVAAVEAHTPLTSVARDRAGRLFHLERGLGADHATMAPSHASLPQPDREAEQARRQAILARLAQRDTDHDPEERRAPTPRQRHLPTHEGHSMVSPDGGTAASADVVHAAAASGVGGTGAALPHVDTIQASFGHHDVGGVRAHVGGAAAEASAAIGAQAYATGDDVAFAAAPDLRQAAHEAAHVVQQRGGGVRLDGGVGRAGDPYEQHADAVAALVVRGDSAEALLDTMAHRGAAGGPAVQRLVSERDAEAVNTVVGLLSNATADVSTTIGRALLAGLDAAIGPVARVTVQFALRGEQYDLMIPIADARVLCGETGMAIEHPAPAPAPVHHGGGRGGGAAARTLRSLQRPGDLASIITALAGEVGEESELEVTIRMPIPETPLHVTGNLTLEVSHTDAGFEVSCEPRLGLGFGSGDDNADLMAGTRIEVTGHDAATAAALVLVAMDHQLRAIAAGGVPPALVAILIAGGVLAPEITAVVVIGDLVGRMANWASTGEPSDPVLLWLADLIFGAGHIGRVSRRMTGEDSVETVDSVAFEAEGGEGTGAHRRDVAVGLATGAHWGLEAEDGEVVESEFRTIDLHFDANFPPWHGSVEAHFPITRGDHVPRGSIEIEMALRTEITSAETYLELDLIARLAQLIVRALTPHRSEAEATIGAACERMTLMEAASGTLASGGRSLIASRVAAAVGAEVGIALSVEVHLGGAGENVFAVKMTDGFEADLPAGDGVEYEHAREIGSITF